jgi:hypothetical protein
MNGISPRRATIPGPAGTDMMSNKSIFGTPFTPNGALKPKPDQMRAFLESRGKNGGGGLHGDDLLGYRRLLENVFAFGREQLQDAKPEDLPRHMVSAVLRSSRFADHNLLSALELYKYHLHALTLKSAEYKTLVAFIRSAEQTLSSLSRDKLDDVLRMVRLREMIEEREKIVEALKPPALAVSAELYRTARYIRGALANVEKRCEASIAMLSDPGVIGKTESQIIDNIKGRPQKALLAGKITVQNLERAKREVELIAKKLSSVMREDSNLLKGVCGALRKQLRKTMLMTEAPLAEIGSNTHRSIEEQQRVFSEIGHAFLSLTANTFEPPARPDPAMHVDGAYEKFIEKKRKEMLGHLFDVLKKDRRSRTDRRSSTSRRKSSDPNFQGSQQRSGKDRRRGNNRRQTS